MTWHKVLILSPIVSTLVFTGCTYTYVEALNPQSHFEYPNSNVRPLGNVSGEASLTTFFTPPLPSGAVQKEAIENALSKKPGADLMVNYISSVEITSWPFPPVFKLTYHVDGTAAEMQIGVQKLDDFWRYSE
jgi:hypothetical protein